MKKLFILLTLFLSFQIYSQEKVIEVDEIYEETVEDSSETPFAVVEKVPVYKGCDDSMTNNELKNCMATSISKHVSKNFNMSIANGLGLEDGRVRIIVIFKINNDGDIVDVISRAPHPGLEEEAIRVIKLIPKMDKPGYQRGKPVIVPYSLPIVVNIQNPKKPSESSKK